MGITSRIFLKNHENLFMVMTAIELHVAIPMKTPITNFISLSCIL